MLSFNTGRKLSNSEREIQVGDILISEQTHPVMVKFDQKKKKYIVEVLNDDFTTFSLFSKPEPIYFELDVFLDTWRNSNMSVSHNVIKV